MDGRICESRSQALRVVKQAPIKLCISNLRSNLREKANQESHGRLSSMVKELGHWATNGVISAFAGIHIHGLCTLWAILVRQACCGVVIVIMFSAYCARVAPCFFCRPSFGLEDSFFRQFSFGS